MCVACQTHEEAHEGLSKCEDCHYVGNVGYWIGTAECYDGSTVHIEGHVYLDNSGETFDVTPLLEEYENIKSFDGSAECPICNSSNLY
ncbi:hypothetical protein [Heyndrickxia sporothermodurans]|uniref:hypothetical protein n=1 Tax=Heyndrickxia sporothermodurans TaxID=46224 RepID=UPI0013FE0C0D|nr:hypothetical protein [Heyndrickxia sporothermodurans]